MPIFQVLFVLIILGVVLWLVNTLIPMVAWVKTLINVLAALLVILWLLSLFAPGFMNISTGRLH